MRHLLVPLPPHFGNYNKSCACIGINSPTSAEDALDYALLQLPISERTADTIDKLIQAQNTLRQLSPNAVKKLESHGAKRLANPNFE